MNALVSYASDSDSDSGSGEGKSPTVTTATVATKTAASSTSQSATNSPEGAATTSTTHYPEDIIPEGVQQGATSQEEAKTNFEDQGQQDNNDDDDDDDFVLAALKDLQSFAASIDTTHQDQDDDTPSVNEPEAASILTGTKVSSVSRGTQLPQDPDHTESTDMDIEQEPETATTIEPLQPAASTPIELTPEQQNIFDTFLQEIDAIPLTNLDQTYPPGYSPHQNSASNSKSSIGMIYDDNQWVREQTPQTIYSQIHQLSTLPRRDAEDDNEGRAFNPKEVESRLIEFAIRMLDWEQGGLKQGYFLGEDRAKAVIAKKELLERTEESKVRQAGSGSSERGSDDGEDEDEGYEDEKRRDDQFAGSGGLPPYGGVVGEMIDFMHAIEQIAPPNHWTIVWSVKDLSYMFRHTATGTESEEYPSTELQSRLDPPSSTSTSAATSTTKIMPIVT
ncbi:MAG: hypothetical protein J3R72DRAFT_126748 [Linnemannia gamsii]|nr:MAG: hypothetical protein J3R72DRAFT_126748 [Linnemannia gamsii]